MGGLSPSTVRVRRTFGGACTTDDVTIVLKLVLPLAHEILFHKKNSFTFNYLAKGRWALT